jgi:hypothetical protein
MSVGLESLFDPKSVVGPSNQAQLDQLKNILTMGGTALAGGAALRGLSGLGQFLGRSLGGAPATPQRQSFVRIPVPVRVRSKAERDAMLQAAQADIAKEAGFEKLAQGAFDWAAKHLGNAAGLFLKPGEQPGWLKNTITGWGQQATPPWAVPAGLAAGLGGLYGGWKLTDYLLDKTRTAEQESEVDAARKEYEAALAGRRKIASADPDPLDALADRFEKQGLWNELLGGGLALGGLAALGSGLGTYRWMRSLSEDKAIEEAVKRRQAQIAEQSPSPIMAVPTPMPVYGVRRAPWHHHLASRLTGKPIPDEGEEEGEKSANISQNADRFINQYRANQRAVWDRMMTPTDGKPQKPAKPQPPPPPRLPSLVNNQGATQHLPVTDAR